MPVRSCPVCLLLLLVLFAAPVVPLQAQAPDPDPARFEAEIEAFAQWDRKNAPPAVPILFVGSSSIRFWATAERFVGLPVINRGFGGSHISDVLYYADQIVLPYAPRIIVFYAGDNDIAAGKTAERVAADYRTFVERVQGVHPGTAIIFLPIKPSRARWSMWPAMADANARIQAYSDAYPFLFYADLATPMLAAVGPPADDLFIADGLHLSPKGYDLWTAHLWPVLAQALAR